MSRSVAAVLALALLGASGAQAAVVISNAATRNMSCSAGICTPTAKNAVLNAGDLQTMLASSDATVNTGAGAVTIAVSASVTWASTSRLTLNASQGISIKTAVVVEGTGAMTLAPSGGALNFYPGGSIAFWDNASSLIIAGNLYTLVGDIATLASDVASHPSGFYALAKDYDASGDGTYGSSPVSTTFFGTFEGLGHTIGNLKIRFTGSGDINLGLFSISDGTLRDIDLADADVSTTTSPNAVGALVGENENAIFGVSASGRVSVPDDIAGAAGGIAGFNGAMISNSTANVIASGANAGGLVGVNGGMIARSFATGAAHGHVAGGLVGTSTGGAITHCRATGDVSGIGLQGDRIGGLVGTSDKTAIVQSFASGSVIDPKAATAGGLVGWNLRGTIVNSFALGAVTSAHGHARIGGLVGWNEHARGLTIRQAYAVGAVSAGGANSSKGGLIGRDAEVSGSVDTAYWDLDTSGISDPSQGAGNIADDPGITGLTTAQFRSGLPAGFDPSIWAESAGINNGYPYLIANPPQ